MLIFGTIVVVVKGEKFFVNDDFQYFYMFTAIFSKGLFFYVFMFKVYKAYMMTNLTDMDPLRLRSQIKEINMTSCVLTVTISLVMLFEGFLLFCVDKALWFQNIDIGFIDFVADFIMAIVAFIELYWYINFTIIGLKFSQILSQGKPNKMIQVYLAYSIVMTWKIIEVALEFIDHN